MKVKNLKVGLRVQYKGNLTDHYENVPTGCLGTVTIVDGTDRPAVTWDNHVPQWTYVGNFKKVKD